MKVNTTKKHDAPMNTSGWVEAVRMTERYLSAPCRADALLIAVRARLGAQDYASCQQLFYGVLRNLSLLRRSVESLCSRKPTLGSLSLMMVAGVELIEAADDAQIAKVTHHAVEMSHTILPPKMGGFVNAVLRRLPAEMKSLPDKIDNPVEKLALINSHPDWLVRRWCEEFGREKTAILLNWDQQVPPVFVRLEEGAVAPECLKASQWTGYYTYEGGGWEAVETMLNAHQAYAQDPSTRLCIELLAPVAGESVLDLCAAPGGKARQLMPQMRGQGVLVCVDLPGGRCVRLRENLAGAGGSLRAEVIESDVFALTADTFASRKLPTLFNAVLLDAPCSNTGVLRRRPDARWRLGTDAIADAAKLQAKLLDKASEFVAPGGRLVYSTCSIEAEENTNIVEAFLAAHKDFKAGASKQAYPWADNHDGAGVFVLTKITNVT